MVGQAQSIVGPHILPFVPTCWLEGLSFRGGYFMHGCCAYCPLKNMKCTVSKQRRVQATLGVAWRRNIKFSGTLVLLGHGGGGGSSFCEDARTNAECCKDSHFENGRFAIDINLKTSLDLTGFGITGLAKREITEKRHGWPT